MTKRKRELIALYAEECSATLTEDIAKKKKVDEDMPLPSHRAAFFAVLEEERQRCLARDLYCDISDKYLLAMVLTYFRRAGLSIEEYGEFFFPALYLANQMEEEIYFRLSIFNWALGSVWMMGKDRLLELRNQLLIRMGFRAWVEPETCELIMAEDPDHWAWRRQRMHHLAWELCWKGAPFMAYYCPICDVRPGVLTTFIIPFDEEAAAGPGEDG